MQSFNIVPLKTTEQCNLEIRAHNSQNVSLKGMLIILLPVNDLMISINICNSNMLE